MTAALSPKQARRMLLAAQGLWQRPRRKADRQAVLAAIRRMGALQIDTIQVVARSPYFVLWSRLGEYEPRWLDELHAQGALFEYWAHAACFLPAEDYPFYRRRMVDGREQAAWKLRWLDVHRALADDVLRRIRDEGPLRSADFERPDGAPRGGWWSWKQEKIALEALFDLGELMVPRRDKFQRLYDLRERVRPDWDDSQLPSREEAARQLILRSVKAMGVARPEWVRTYLPLPTPRAEATALMKKMVAAGELRSMDVAGWPGHVLVHPDNLPLLDQVSGRAGPRPPTTLLSPCDPVVWAPRDRTLEMFGFDYTIECYTPGPKRKYGYFSLPILHRDALVGRLDAKAHRKEGLFEVKALHLEDGLRPTDDLVTGLRDALARCAAWHRTPEVVVRWSDPPALARAVSG